MMAYSFLFRFMGEREACEAECVFFHSALPIASSIATTRPQVILVETLL